MSLKNAEGLSKTGDPSRAPPKAMSSRLLTMKFMQRATNSALAGSKSASPNTPLNLSTATGMTTTTDSSPSTTKLMSSTAAKQAKRDHAALQAALAEEEKNRQSAIRRRAEETGDSMWELAIVSRFGRKQQVGGNVKVVGYAEIVAGEDEEVEDEDEDGKEPWGVQKMGLGGNTTTASTVHIKGEESSDDDDGEEEAEDDNDDDESSSDTSSRTTRITSTSGRLTYGNFTRHKPFAQTAPDDSNSASDSDSDSNSKQKPKPDSNPLRNATSISGGKPSTSTSQKDCYNCSAVGHIAIECPKERILKGRKRERDDGEGIGGDKKAKKDKGFSGGAGRGGSAFGFAGAGVNKNRGGGGGGGSGGGGGGEKKRNGFNRRR